MPKPWEESFFLPESEVLCRFLLRRSELAQRACAAAAILFFPAPEIFRVRFTVLAWPFAFAHRSICERQRRRLVNVDGRQMWHPVEPPGIVAVAQECSQSLLDFLAGGRGWVLLHPFPTIFGQVFQ